MAHELKFEIVDLCAESEGQRCINWETGLLRFLTVFFGPDERRHKISARTIGDRLKVRTPAYSFDEDSHRAVLQSAR
jgi:hypothetical protein